MTLSYTLLVRPRAKRFEYAASVDGDGELLADEQDLLEPGPAWTPEHLLLAGLVRCTLTSLVHHAGRAGISVSSSGSASGVVTRREDDGRFGLVEVQCGLDVELDPLPEDAELQALIAKAERDCFVVPRSGRRPSTSSASTAECFPADRPSRERRLHELDVSDPGFDRPAAVFGCDGVLAIGLSAR